MVVTVSKNVATAAEDGLLLSNQAQPDPHRATRIEMARHQWKSTAWDVRFAGENGPGTGAPFPVSVDLKLLYKTSRQVLVLQDLDGKAFGVALKMFMGLAYKIYRFEPVYHGQQPSKKQTHEGKCLYEYGKVSSSAGTTTIVTHFSTEFKMTTTVSGSPEYRATLKGKKGPLQGVHGLSLEISKDGRACGSARNANNMNSLWVINILPGIDPAAIIAFIASVDNLLNA
mmetsp:Transcript_8380/g.13875  ORF Transcript_8380/g.13875 Transcript_8380/m.13875 type:complete len:228 (+) Transcript_8380:93-776(+)|eukprot:CAMPEP_0119003722 /NCGR_PEP_ID=MMETSP1176-20130426/732_1 /TAXON_ID=265551 /ORGANISM="Synedropsis recta cf, Strain CCMP1620" /LENGTH=227 /DNA_ID=CAMNT_0006955347 /DNA_START=90 /DNA_END=773 /DNA_ORIENTATION=-